MGMTTGSRSAAPSLRPRGSQGDWAVRWLPVAAWASLGVNALIVLTGGIVRLTGSGLGCPTWPRCTEDSFTPHGALSYHSAIEFGNRMVTFLIAAIALATVVIAVKAARDGLVRLAVILALGVPAQAVIGGLTVLTDLNPWVVAFHFLVSMAMICTAVLFVMRVRGHGGPLRPDGVLGWLAALTFMVGWAVLYAGTVVTGSGPHAGDLEAPRNGLDPRTVSQVHADLVFLLLGLSVALVFVSYAVGTHASSRLASRVLLAVICGQGVIGYVQYYTGLPEVLVALHLVGACATAAALTWTWLTWADLTRADKASRAPTPDQDPVPRPA